MQDGALEELGLVTVTDRLRKIQQAVVTASQMRDVETRVFEAGMPVAALMEKVGGLIAQRIQALYTSSNFPQIGVLVGPGHNGGDALIVARELHFKGYAILVYCPVNKLKELTAQHTQYAKSLGIPFVEQTDALQGCDLLIDGLFGFGLTRSLDPPFSDVIGQINQWPQPVISIDIPSGLHSDTGEVLGTAVHAQRTFCLGLWKLGLLQDHALEFTGITELVDWDIPLADILAVFESPRVHRITPEAAIAQLPLPRSATTHKYKVGHLLLVCGSHRYAGGAILTGLGARASGVGMLSIATPQSLQPILTAQLPDALIRSCPETETGAIAGLPEGTDLGSFDAIACGPGLTLDASTVVEQVLESCCPLVLDADGLNALAQFGTVPTLAKRQAPTVLTPHLGEFKRLFSEVDLGNRVIAVRTAAQRSGAVVLLKGARTAIANPEGSVWLNSESTPALARGGSGDVLTGLLGGIVAQTVCRHDPIESAVQSAAWWHAQAGILAAQERTELGVDAFALSQYLIPALKAALNLAT